MVFTEFSDEEKQFPLEENIEEEETANDNESEEIIKSEEEQDVDTSASKPPRRSERLFENSAKKNWWDSAIPQGTWNGKDADVDEETNVAGFLHLSMGDELNTVVEALTGADACKWEQAMKEEMSSLMENKTWAYEQLPARRKAIRCKWVFKIKVKADGSLDKYKARLVAKGYSQKEGIDYKETYAPVAKLTSVRSLLGVAAMHNLEIHQMDVKTAFLNGDLEEEMFMEQPEGFKDRGTQGKVCKLVKSLYGQKQAPRQWNKKLHEALIAIEFQQFHSDPCLYVRASEDAIVVLGVYVDDFIIVASSMQILAEIKGLLSTKFQMEDIGELKSFLGMSIRRDRENKLLWLSQEKYCADILKRFNMQDCKSGSTPMEKNSDDTLEEQKVFNIPYQNAVGSLMYLMVCTRPDLSFAVCKVSQKNKSPTNQDWQAVKRIFRYLQGTQHYELCYNGRSEANLYGYNDADFAGDPSDRKSTSGYVFILAGGAISWSSKKQASVATSTLEAEYIALAAAAKEALWLFLLLS